MARSRPDRKPSFWWQGILIVLPVVVLAAVGFKSLQQDKVLARHAAALIEKAEYTEDAKQMARNPPRIQRGSWLSVPAHLMDNIFRAPSEDAAGEAVAF